MSDLKQTMNNVLNSVERGGVNIFKHRSQNDHSIATRGLDMIITWSIAIAFFLVPIFFTGQVAQGLGFEKIVLFYFLALAGIVAWVTKGALRGELEIKRTPLDWPIVGLLAILVISTLLSVNIKDSFVGSYGNTSKSLIAAIIFILFYYLVVNNLNKSRIKLYFWAFIASGALAIIYSLFQIFKIYLLPLEITKFNNFNPIGSLSGLTSFIILMMPLLIVAIAQLKVIYPKLPGLYALIIKSALGAIALAGMAILIILNGFTFWPILIVAVVIMLMFFLSKIISISGNSLIIPVAAFLLAMILLIIGNFRIFNMDLPMEVSLSRLQSWKIAKSTLAHDPFFGSGPSTFYYDFSKYKGQEFNASPLWNVRFNTASGAIFDSMSTIGALGTLALITVFLTALSVAFLSLIKAADKEVDSIFLGFFSSFISLLIFLVVFAAPESLIIIGLLISILTVAMAVAAYPGQFKSLKLSFRASAKYSLALAAIFLSVSAGVVILFTIGLKMYLADAYVARLPKLSDNAQKIDRMNQALSLANYQDNYYLILANLFMGEANKIASESKDQAQIERYLAQAIETGKRGVDLAPQKAENNEALALIYENASFYTRGALEWSENYYKKLIELEPDNPVPFLRIALINMARANAEKEKTEQEFYINEAVKKYDEAIAKKSDFAAAYYGKAIAFERLAKLGDAIDQLKQAVILSRNNIDYGFELGRLYFNRGITQPNIAQNAATDITKGENNNELSVEPDQATGAEAGRNEDLNMSEQVFLAILQNNPNHANSLYSLALLYQKVGETDNAKLAVKRLLEVLTDEPTKEAVKKQFPGLY